MNKNAYNGWTNYETWLVKLWMDNDEGSYRMFQDMADDYLKQDGEDSPSGFANAIKEAHESSLPELTGFAADLINAAMSEVNWFEIATSLFEEAKERVAA